MVIVWLVSLFAMTGAVRWNEFSSYTSGHANLHSLSPSSFVSFLQANNLSIVWFHPSSINASDKDAVRHMRDAVLAPVAHRLQIPVAEFPTNDDSAAVTKTLGVNASDIDTIHVYSRLRRIVYHGSRTSEALISFVKKQRCPSFSVIAGKVDKKQFEMVDRTRVLSFVVPGSESAAVYAAASRAVASQVPFYVVVDEAVARTLRLLEGDVHLYRPGHHQPAAELKRPVSSVEIVSFIRREMLQPFFHMKRLNSENVHSFWREKPDQPKFVLLTSSVNSPRSLHFQKLLRRAIKNNTDCEINVMDMDAFPRMTDYWRDNFRVEHTGKPLLGYVALHNSSAIWLGDRQLNTTEGKDADRQNEKIIADFVGLILNGSVTFGHGVADHYGGLPVMQMNGPNRGSEIEDGTPLDLAKLRADIHGTHNDGYQSADADRDEWDVLVEDDQGSRFDNFLSRPVVAPTRRREVDERLTNEKPQDAIHKFEHDLTSFGAETHKHDRMEF